jgi:N6-adenosine-specific RNA methylase IME4
MPRKQRNGQRTAKRQVKAPKKAKPAAKRRALKPIAPALAALVDKGKGAAPVLIAPGKIKIGERHRKEFGDLKQLATSINDRGGLLQPIAITSRHELIAGERRLRAWALSRFAGQPIPCHVIDVDALVAGEWDENAQRKDFTPSEAVSIKRALESVLARIATPAANAGKVGRPATGRANEKVGKLTGVSRVTLERAEKVVEAAERDPEKFGDLQAEMDRTGKVNAPFKKLTVREQRAAIEAAPPPLPGNLKQCGTVVIDFPWAAEMDREQASIDAADRSFRGYPEMSIKACCKFATDEIAPQLADQVAVWLWVTNFVLVRGYASHVIAALGFKPEQASTLLTWDKVDPGRGRLLRDQTEHVILLTRGKPLVDVFGANPPTTLISERRRDNSRKPDAFYRLVERVTPAKRYASIFSRGGEGAAWDGHGDQVGKFAPASATAVEGEVVDELTVLEIVAEGNELALDVPMIDIFRERGLVTGRKEIRLTKAGLDRLDELRQAAEGAEAAASAPAATAEPQQVDLEDAIAAKAAADPLDIPDFLKRTAAAA